VRKKEINIDEFRVYLRDLGKCNKLLLRLDKTLDKHGWGLDLLAIKKDWVGESDWREIENLITSKFVGVENIAAHTLDNNTILDEFDKLIPRPGLSDERHAFIIALIEHEEASIQNWKEKMSYSKPKD
jgi:hypothetical protein